MTEKKMLADQKTAQLENALSASVHGDDAPFRQIKGLSELHICSLTFSDVGKYREVPIVIQ